MFDHLWETSFDDFRWPPYGVNVLSEVERATISGKLSAFTVNDPRALQYKAVPKCNTKGKEELLIIVKSAVSNEKQRDAIRRTWGSRQHQEGASTIFVVGDTTDGGLQSNLEEEILANDDILHVDFLDSYRNNTRKFVHSIKYAFERGNGCRSPKFLLLVDDDYIVNTADLVHYVSRADSSRHLYEGWMFDTTPFRFRLHKHAVSLEMYPFDRYPTYISAGAVLMSQHTFSYFYYAMQMVQMYPFDDIYAGILAHLLHIPPKHNEAFVFWTRTVSVDEWKRGAVLAAHGYSPDQIIKYFPLLS
ncbi:hypothetical protein Q1695_015125 [Nippostrongylus brasiliensis]|nr:hypothetical protein Q1695_015125 [Nippostrongylus brasiliensis]